MRRADSSSAAYEQPNPPAKSEVKPMATSRVQAQMRKDKKCRSSMRYAADGKAALEVSRTLYVQDPAFAKLGRPDVITITIEAVRMPGSE